MLGHDVLAEAHVKTLKALAVEANRDRAALQELCGVRLLLPDFCSLASSQMPNNFHGNQLESGVDRAVLSWRGMYSLPHHGPEFLAP